MRISTWNIERLKHKKSLEAIKGICESLQADILVLTETDEQVKPEYGYAFHTLKPIIGEAVRYRETENRVSVYTNYNCIRKYDTYDPYTTICVELDTPMGALIVYGTIMGIYGNRHRSYLEDLKKQAADITRLLSGGKPVCICGDFNYSFSDNYYFTNASRDMLLTFFDDIHMTVLTGGRSECIDHIVVSDSFINGCNVTVDEWNYDKSISDHKGIMVDLF